MRSLRVIPPAPCPATMMLNSYPKTKLLGMEGNGPADILDLIPDAPQSQDGTRRLFCGGFPGACGWFLFRAMHTTSHNEATARRISGHSTPRINPSDHVSDFPFLPAYGHQPNGTE
jgi:hypothetical protein